MKFFVLLLILFCHTSFDDRPKDKIILSKSELYNKIKGGWAGQFIGVTYAADGAASASIARRNENIQWPDGYQIATYNNNPEHYDDVFIDLSLLEAMQEYGVEVTPAKLSQVYINATYHVNHGCQSGRYNLIKGKSPQRSGYWLDNPHADDNDFQSHADFIGMIYPGQPLSASHLSNKVGHLTNFGDGYYGGLYVSTLYSLAFTTNDAATLVKESLGMIPEKSAFRKCVEYALSLHQQYPYAWDRALGHFQRKWGENFGCPDRLLGKEDADAKVNSAYVTLALLYGEGDFEKTLQIARSIRRADCNVATVAGIMGVMLGFDNIPEQWHQGIDEIETQPFHHSNLSLAEAYDITMRLATGSIKGNKGIVSKDHVVLRKQYTSPVKFERSFEGHYPKEVRSLGDTLLTHRIDLEFDGIGFVLRGLVPDEDSDDVLLAELYLNNKYIQVVEMPLKNTDRSPELAWKFQLPYNHYQLSLRPLKKDSKLAVRLTDLVIYDVTPN